MVATMKVYFDWGGADTSPDGSPADVTDATPPSEPPTLRFKNADDAVVDANDKLVIPADGTKYSFWKHLFLFCADADGHTINNVAIYSDGSNTLGTGVDVKVGLEFPVKTSASSAGYEKAAVDEDLVTNHTGISTVATIFNYTTGEATDLDVSINEAGNVIDAANETSNYVLLQMEVLDTASPGDLTNEVGTFSYDEA